MPFSRSRALTTAVAGLAILGLAACSSSQNSATDTATASTVTITTNNGEMDVATSPVRVAVLDNTAMATVKALGITPVAVPKPLIPTDTYSDWINDDAIADVGSHREPQLEVLNEAAPDLIIGGYRFGEYTDDLAAIAPTIDIAPSEESAGGYIEGLRAQTTALGQIFEATDTTDDIVSSLDESISAADSAVNGESVFLAVASGGKIDNGAGRIGHIIEPLNLVDVFAAEDKDLDSGSVHNDSGLAPETVAEANPDWLIMLDRDAAVSEDGAEVTPAQQLVTDQAAWKNVTFVTKDQQIYLPNDFYLTEGIQDYTAVYTQISSAFSGS